MTVPLFQVDAFADRAFAGNPAAVCLLEGPADAAWMQAVAAEMNLSETAFLHREDAGYALRWFTPVAEVALCGHATLASAHALWESGRAEPAGAIDFTTLSGTLSAARDGEWIVMDFPSTPPEPAEAPRRAGRGPRPRAALDGPQPLRLARRGRLAGGGRRGPPRHGRAWRRSRGAASSSPPPGGATAPTSPRATSPRPSASPRTR